MQTIMNEGLEKAISITAVISSGKLATTWASIKAQANVEKSGKEIKELASPESILSVNIKGRLTTVWGSIKVLD